MFLTEFQEILDSGDHALKSPNISSQDYLKEAGNYLPAITGCHEGLLPHTLCSLAEVISLGLNSKSSYQSENRLSVVNSSGSHHHHCHLISDVFPLA